MNRNCFVAGLALVLVGSFALVNPAVAGESVLKQAESAIKTAEAEVQAARKAIERGKALVALIPQDDILFSDVAPAAGPSRNCRRPPATICASSRTSSACRST